MEVRCALFVSKNGNVRVNKTGSGVRPNEIAMKVRISIPDAFFHRPEPVVDIVVPKSAVGEMAPSVVARITAETVAGALGLAVDDVVDGLEQLVSARDEVEGGRDDGE